MEANFHGKRTYNLGIMRFLVFRIFLGNQKTSYFKGFCGQFFVTYHKNSSIKLPNDPSCSIHEFYKGMLQS